MGHAGGVLEGGTQAGTHSSPGALAGPATFPRYRDRTRANAALWVRSARTAKGAGRSVGARQLGEPSSRAPWRPPTSVRPREMRFWGLWALGGVKRGASAGQAPGGTAGTPHTHEMDPRMPAFAALLDRAPGHHAQIPIAAPALPAAQLTGQPALPPLRLQPRPSRFRPPSRALGPCPASAPTWRPSSALQEPRRAASSSSSRAERRAAAAAATLLPPRRGIRTSP